MASGFRRSVQGAPAFVDQRRYESVRRLRTYSSLLGLNRRRSVDRTGSDRAHEAAVTAVRSWALERTDHREVECQEATTVY